MPVYKGRRPGTYRVLVWSRGRSNEWIVEGTRKEATSFEARKRIELDAQPVAKMRVAPIFAELCALHYRPWAEHHLGAKTWRVRRYQLETLCVHFGDYRLTELTTELADSFKRVRLEQGVKSSVVNGELTILRTILHWARDERSFPIAALSWRMLPVPKSTRPQAFTRLELARLFRSAQEIAPYLVPMIVVLVNTGLRKSESIAAEWSWVDWREKLLRLPVTEKWAPKSKKPREVPLSDAVLRTLRRIPRRGEAIFINRFGNRYREFPDATWDKVVARAKLEGGPHKLRHTFASLFLEAKPDLFQLSKILGHSHTKTTEMYSHLLPGHLKTARNVVDIGPNHGGHHGGRVKSAS